MTTPSRLMPDAEEEEARKFFATNRGCTCGAVDIGVGDMHEPYCGQPGPDDLADLLRAFASRERAEERERCKRDVCCACAGESFPNVKGYRTAQGPNEAGNFVHRAPYGDCGAKELHTLCAASGIFVREAFAAALRTRGKE